MPTWAISALSRVDFEIFAELLDDRADGLVDAALELHRVGAGRDELGALAEDRLGEHGGGRGAVAGDVGGLRGDLLHHLAPMFSKLSSSSISLATVTPSLVTVGEPQLFSISDVAAARAERDLHGVGQRVDALEHALAGVLVVADLLGAMGGSSLLEHGEDVVLAHDQVLLAVDLDLGAGVLAEQHAVALLHVERA